MNGLKQSGRFELGTSLAAALHGEFRATSADEIAVAATIKRVFEQSGNLLDPHTACAAHAVSMQGCRSVPEIILATAHPAKFPDAMQKIIGLRPALPSRLARLMTDPEHMTQLPNDNRAIETFIAQKTRVLQAAPLGDRA